MSWKCDAMIGELRKTYFEKREAIRARLAEFETIMLEGDDERLFEEIGRASCRERV